MGAIVAFECCRLLRKNYGLLPVRLFVSGRNAPHVPDPDPPVHNASKAAFLEELRRFKGTPEEILNSSAMMELLLPILRADFEVLETYTYLEESSLECPITAFGGLEDVKTTADGLEAWGEHTIDSFSVRELPGDHFFINSAQSLLLQHITYYTSLIKLW
jgi:medium-chain acyl-[acyl-carrier-protein] hydrolase